jgi:hypothetical protein
MALPVKGSVPPVTVKWATVHAWQPSWTEYRPALNGGATRVLWLQAVDPPTMNEPRSAPVGLTWTRLS